MIEVTMIPPADIVILIEIMCSSCFSRFPRNDISLDLCYSNYTQFQEIIGQQGLVKVAKNMIHFGGLLSLLTSVFRDAC